jgi:hypothetical protein
MWASFNFFPFFPLIDIYWKLLYYNFFVDFPLNLTVLFIPNLIKKVKVNVLYKIICLAYRLKKNSEVKIVLHVKSDGIFVWFEELEIMVPKIIKLRVA